VNLIFRPEAESDIAAAYGWYEERAPGLGEEFLRALDVSVASIRRNPLAYPEKHRGVRRVLLRRFPYGLFYLADNQQITVLACLHARRNPRRWPSA
jgi:toxin ParE1/3/4